jgi:hypothetical protein
VAESSIVLPPGEQDAAFCWQRFVEALVARLQIPLPASRFLVKKPMTLEELNVFCGEMYKRLEFKSHSERLVDILKWAEDWQSKNLPRSAA